YTVSVAVLFTVHLCCSLRVSPLFRSFFCTAPPPTQISTLSLHDALPISQGHAHVLNLRDSGITDVAVGLRPGSPSAKKAEGEPRSEEHTSELQSRENLVCRLLLEKKKKIENEFAMYS